MPAAVHNLALTAWLAPLLAAAAAAAMAWLVDRRPLAAGAGHPAAGAAIPPGFAVPWRRAAAFALVAATLYSGLLLPLAIAGLEAEVDLAAVHPARLFLLHALLAAVMAAWALLAFAAGGSTRAPVAVEPPAAWSAAPPAPPRSAGRPFAAAAAALRLRARDPGREVAVGLIAGVGAWAVVLAAALALAGLISILGGEGLLPTGAPPLVVFLAGQPVWLRLGVSLSAGVVEETFFRGFLQPRLGLGLTTLLFILAHAGYGEPLQLVAVGLLSVIYGLLARWRGNVWAAISAHALFDAVQLLVVIPAALELLANDTTLGALG